jgi:hypothetical protein
VRDYDPAITMKDLIDYLRVRREWAATTIGSFHAAEARIAIESGRHDEADALLLRARDKEVLAARQAEQLAVDALQAVDQRLLRAAEADGKRGELA